MTSPRFTIEHISFDRDSYALVVTVDSAHYGRAFRLQWAPHLDDQAPLAVLAHWSDDCVESNSDLCPNVVWELERFMDASDDVAEALDEAVGTRWRVA